LVKKGSNFYQLESTPLLESLHRPRFFLNLQLTSRCNFDCKHCYNQLKNKHLKNPDLSLKAVEKVCRQFLAVERAKDFADISVYLLGGEPFLHPELPEILKMVSQLKVDGVYFNDVRLGSNGLLIPKNIDLLKQARDLFERFSVQVSIDGDAKIYQQIRGQKIDIPLRALDVLARNNIKRQIAISISRQNRFSLEYILGLCDKYDASPHITPYVPFNEDLEVLTRSEWETFKLALTGMLERRYVGACGYDFGCGIGWNGTSIDPEGYIIGCPRDTEVMGHIDNVSLMDKKLWRTKSEGPFLFYERCGRFIKNDIKEKRLSITFPPDNNTNQPSLKITRDTIFSKNIYYYTGKEGFFYGTDLKALLSRIPNLKPDAVGVHNFITFGYLPFERTHIKDLYKLEPGQTLTWDKEKGVNIENNWKHPDNVSVSDEDFYKRRISSMLETSIKESVESGNSDKSAVLLSGGIDSSFIASLLKRASRHKIRTVTIACDGWMEDISYARTVARHLDSDHKEIILSSKEAVENLVKMAGLIDLPTSNLRMFMGKYHKDNPDFMLLTGFGADEIFLGWPQYRKLLQAGDLKRDTLLPQSVRSQNTRTLEPLLKGYLFNDTEKKALLTNEAFEQARAYFTSQLWSPYTQYQTPEEGIRKLQAFYLQHRLPNWQLTWAGFDNVHPYLENKFVEFSLQIPLKYKISDGAEKYILRKSAESYLPEQILNRADTHTSLPLEQWFESGLKEKMMPLLMDSYLVTQGIFNWKYIENLINSNDKRELIKVYLLGILEIWFRSHQ